jgi:arylsulfatase A-like enzyme/uncharacterized protein YggT (Ycf19 family)
MLIAVADPLNPALRPFRSAFEPLNQIAFSLAVLVPVLLVTGALVGLLLRLARRISLTLHRLTMSVLLMAWVGVIFAYAAFPIPAGDTAKVYEPGGVKHIVETVVAAGLSFAALYGLALLLLRTRSKTTAIVLAAVIVLSWGTAAAWTSVEESKPAFPATVPPSRSQRPNVLLIVLDAVRPDHMSCYGYHRKTTPSMDAFARSARVYRNAVSPSCWTLPSHASLFTGLPYSAHGVGYDHQHLDQRFETLAEKLKAAGYHTVGVSANGFVSSFSDLNRGFEFFWNPVPRKCPGRRLTVAETLVWDVLKCREWLSFTPPMQRRIGEWFRNQYRPDKPFFMFLNYLDVHQYDVPTRHRFARSRLKWTTPEVVSKWEEKNQRELVGVYLMTGRDTLSPREMLEWETLYDERLAYVDRQVGKLLTFLRRNGLDGNTLILITADHGEQLGEHHMFGHQYALYEPAVHVPLILKWGDHVQAGEDDNLVQSHDIYATILDAAGIPWQKTPAHNSESLLRTETGKPRPCFSECLAPALPFIGEYSARYPTLDFRRFLRRLRSARVGDMKLIRSSDGTFELYDLARDPFETRNLAADQLQTVKQLQKVLDDWLLSFRHYEPAAVTPEDIRKLSPEELDVLRGLGYIR